MTADPHTNATLLQEFLLFLAVSGVMIPLLQHWRISQVLGFLAAGTLIGPYGLGAWVTEFPWLEYLTISNRDGASVLGEMGVIFLLFVIGLELPADRLWSMRRWVIGAGSLQILLCAAVIGGLAAAFGNRWETSAVLGLSLSLSSTAVVMQLLAERREIAAPIGRASFSILLMQDLAVVPLLILVGVMGVSGGASFLAVFAGAIVKALVAITLIYLLGRRVVGPFFRRAAVNRQPDTFMAAILLATLGTAALTYVAGLSMALGAFLAGLLLAETEYRHEVRISIEPFKGLLIGLFFMSVGMAIDLTALARDPFWILASVVGLFAIKAGVVTALTRAFGLSWGVAVEAGLLLGQGGEFGFIVVGIAITQGLLEPAVGQFMMLVVGFSMLATPLMARVGLGLGRRLDARLRPAEAELPASAIPELEGHVIIAGFGRVGQLLGQVLDGQNVPYVAIDSDAREIARQRDQGLPVYYGDASHPEFLRHAGAGRAQVVVVTMDRVGAALTTVTAMRRHFDAVPVVARARDEAHARALRQAGATLVVPETLEAGLQLAGHVLEQMGVPPDSCSVMLQQEREKQLAALRAPARQERARAG